MVAVVALLLLAAFQVALQAKPAQAWEASVSIKGAGQVTEVTDRGLIASDCAGGLDSPSTTPSGQIGDSCSPGSPSGLYASGDVVEYMATPKTGFQFVGWRNNEDTGSTYRPVLCDDSNGSADYSGQNCRFQMWENLKARAVFADTTAPPQPSVSGPTSPVNQSATFFFPTPSDPTLKQFECRVQNVTNFQTCSSPFSVNLTGSSYTSGNYTFQVQARDYSDNVSPIVSTVFTVDKTVPNTTITSGPAHNSTTQDRNPSFAFESMEMGTFQCNLTGPGLTNSSFFHCGSFFSSNTGTTAYSNLKDGTYTFKVRANDQAGNTDLSPAERTWTINNQPTVLENSLVPAKGATGVSRTTGVGATFSEEMSPTTLREADDTSKTFKLQQYNKKTKKWKSIPATIALSLVSGKTVATLDPYGATEGTGEQPLAANKKFRGMITTGVKDLDSNPLARNFVWTFNTGSVVG